VSDKAREIAAPLMAALHAVPGTDLGSCAICHSSVKAGYQQCWNCNQGKRLLGVPPLVLPISMSAERGQLHHALRHYKDGFDEAVKGRFALQLAGLVELFASRHTSCIGSSWEVVTCVPSTKGRTAFKAVVDRLGRYRNQYEDLLTVTSTDGSHTHSASRFRALEAARNRRVLLLDDTFTTGASVFSATSALRSAGATVDTVLVVGRHMNATYAPTVELLERMKGMLWTEDKCVVCRPSSTLF
jgi:hypothetical protein